MLKLRKVVSQKVKKHILTTRADTAFCKGGGSQIPKKTMMRDGEHRPKLVSEEGMGRGAEPLQFCFKELALSGYFNCSK